MAQAFENGHAFLQTLQESMNPPPSVNVAEIALHLICSIVTPSSADWGQ